MLTTPRTLLVLLAGGALASGIAACGSSNDGGPSVAEQTVKVDPADTTADATATTAATTAATTTPAEAPVKTTSKGAVLPISTNLKKKPSIPKPKGTPPKGLVVKDIVTGKGAAIKSGQTATVKYVGVSYSTGKQFDASWDRGQTFPFPLGQGQVIKGWDEGVVGMKVGGRRELVIPSDLGYGDAGSPPSIKGGETLVFVIDLTKIS